MSDITTHATSYGVWTGCLQQVGPRRARGLRFAADETWCVRYVLDDLSTIRLGLSCSMGVVAPLRRRSNR